MSPGILPATGQALYGLDLDPRLFRHCIEYSGSYSHPQTMRLGFSSEPCPGGPGSLEGHPRAPNVVSW